MIAGSHRPVLARIAWFESLVTAGPGVPPSGAGGVKRRHPQWGGAVREERSRPAIHLLSCSMTQLHRPSTPGSAVRIPMDATTPDLPLRSTAAPLRRVGSRSGDRGYADIVVAGTRSPSGSEALAEGPEHGPPLRSDGARRELGTTDVCGCGDVCHVEFTAPAQCHCQALSAPPPSPAAIKTHSARRQSVPDARSALAAHRR